MLLLSFAVDHQKWVAGELILPDIYSRDLSTGPAIPSHLDPSQSRSTSTSNPIHQRPAIDAPQQQLSQTNLSSHKTRWSPFDTPRGPRAACACKTPREP